VTTLIGFFIGCSELPSDKEALRIARLGHFSVSQRVKPSGFILGIFSLTLIDSFDLMFVEPLIVVYLKESFKADFLVLGAVFLLYAAPSFFLPRYIGRASDRIGRLQVASVGLFLSGLTLLALPFSRNLGEFTMFLTMSGIMTMFPEPVISAFLLDLSPPTMKGTFMGINGLFRDVGFTLGPILGGLAWDCMGSTRAFQLVAIVEIMGAFLAWLLIFTKRSPEI
jgi:MFS family permease